MNYVCSKTNCNLKVGHRLFDGKQLCDDHYRGALFHSAHQSIELWDGDEKSPMYVMKMIGRIYEEFGTVMGNSYLSSTRISDRTWNWCRANGKITFSITRHPGAWSESMNFSRVVQTWEVSVSDFTFTLVDERPWIKGEPDKLK